MVSSAYPLETLFKYHVNPYGSRIYLQELECDIGVCRRLVGSQRRIKLADPLKEFCPIRQILELLYILLETHELGYRLGTLHTVTTRVSSCNSDNCGSQK